MAQDFPPQIGGTGEPRDLEDIHGPWETLSVSEVLYQIEFDMGVCVLMWVGTAFPGGVAR